MTCATLQGSRQQWLGQYQETAIAYAQQGYDQLQEYIRSNFDEYVEANNLTQVCFDSCCQCSTQAQPSLMTHAT